ncbi:hypothetical protein SVIOM342S_01957 [Streptomyces violaceorubidus]
MASTQPASHGAGHNRPVNSGKLFVACSRSLAARQSERATRSFHSGIRLPRGQASWQNGTPQSMHGSAWRPTIGSSAPGTYTSSSGRPSGTTARRSSSSSRSSWACAGSTRAPFSANTSVSTWSMSSWTDSMTLRKSSTTWSAIACSTADGPLASCAGSDSSPSRNGPSEPVPSVPHGDDEVLPGEHHDLAGAHHLARGRQFLVLHVADRLEHGEERLAAALDLGRLVGLDRVLDGQGMQLEELRDTRELLVRRLVQAEPDEARSAPAHPRHGLDRIATLGRADTLPVGHAVHHRGTQRGTGVVAQVHPRPSTGQPSHLPEAAGPSQPRDLPQIPRHGHPTAPRGSPRGVLPAPWHASLPARREGRTCLWKQQVPLRSRLWTEHPGAAHAPAPRAPAARRGPLVPERRPLRTSGTIGTVPQHDANRRIPPRQRPVRGGGALRRLRHALRPHDVPASGGTRRRPRLALLGSRSRRHLRRVVARQTGRTDRQGPRDGHRHLTGRPGPAGRRSRCACTTWARRNRRARASTWCTHGWSLSMSPTGTGRCGR